jgi:hypothetical protein
VSGSVATNVVEYAVPTVNVGRGVVVVHEGPLPAVIAFSKPDTVEPTGGLVPLTARLKSYGLADTGRTSGLVTIADVELPTITLLALLATASVPTNDAVMPLVKLYPDTVVESSTFGNADGLVDTAIGGTPGSEVALVVVNVCLKVKERTSPSAPPTQTILLKPPVVTKDFVDVEATKVPAALKAYMSRDVSLAPDTIEYAPAAYSFAKVTFT